jgi:hypothetical protein
VVAVGAVLRCCQAGSDLAWSSAVASAGVVCGPRPGRDFDHGCGSSPGGVVWWRFSPKSLWHLIVAVPGEGNPLGASLVSSPWGSVVTRSRPRGRCSSVPVRAVVAVIPSQARTRMIQHCRGHHSVRRHRSSQRTKPVDHRSGRHRRSCDYPVDDRCPHNRHQPGSRGFPQFGTCGQRPRPIRVMGSRFRRGPATV